MGISRLRRFVMDSRHFFDIKCSPLLLPIQPKRKKKLENRVFEVKCKNDETILTLIAIAFHYPFSMQTGL